MHQLATASAVIISIHAPGKGSDLLFLYVISIPGISIHAPGKGSDYIALSIPCDKNISIHAPGKGSDSKSKQKFNIIFTKHYFFCENIAKYKMFIIFCFLKITK